MDPSYFCPICFHYHAVNARCDACASICYPKDQSINVDYIDGTNYKAFKLSDIRIYETFKLPVLSSSSITTSGVYFYPQTDELSDILNRLEAIRKMIQTEL